MDAESPGPAAIAGSHATPVFPRFGSEVDLDQFLAGPMQAALAGGDPIIRGDMDLLAGSEDEVTALAEKEGFRLVFSSGAPPASRYVLWGKNDRELLLYSTWDRSGSTASYFLLSKATEERFGEFLSPRKQPEKKGDIEVVFERHGNLSSRPLGKLAKELERENYAPNVLEQIDYVGENLDGQDPPGRIILLAGPPGTGKTHVVRHWVGQTKGKVLMVPPHFIGSLEGPAFLSLLSSLSEMATSVVLVVEDADSILLERQQDNMHAVSTLLSAGDGLLGTLLNLRVILSTNASISPDRAFMRPGRLLCRLDLQPLSPDQADRVYQRLVPNGHGDRRKPNEKATLAEVYADARSRL